MGVSDSSNVIVQVTVFAMTAFVATTAILSVLSRLSMAIALSASTIRNAEEIPQFATQ